MINQTPSPVKKRQWFIITILFLVFVIPIVLAWLLYDFDQGAEKVITKTTNHGVLLQPTVDLSRLTLKTSNGQSFDQEQIRGKWLMLYVIPTTCNPACEKNLYFMRQIRLATGKDMDRIQRLVVTFPHKKADAHLNQLLQTEDAGTLQAVADTKQFQQILGSSPSTTLAMTQGYLYLVDPLGNVMMGYALTANPMDIFKDLQKLLRVSQIG